ncbi:PREDICTED: inorganic pyrophosphatase, partial [Papilio polytes]|uniref:inorganic pyrophosphatase n=1 Tax=Papilio polytes TaxID=76194 RepID=UPI00067632A0
MSLTRVAIRSCVSLSRQVLIGSGYCRRGLSSSSVVYISKVRDEMFIAEERGSPYAPDYRVFFRDESGPVSPLHDIPLWADRARRLAHMVVEVPRWTNAKMEISLGETLNPIKQDVKKGALRYV